MSDSLVMDAPRDLNLLWFIAHAQGWCPYGGDNCSMVSDPVVRALASLPGASDLPSPGATRRMWDARGTYHATGPREPGDDWRQLDDPERDLVLRLDRAFIRFWESMLGPRMALSAFERHPRIVLEEWRRVTPVRTLDSVGSERAAVARGHWAAVGAAGLGSQDMLLALLRPKAGER